MENKNDEFNKHVKDLESNIEDFTINNLREYCIANNDDINRIILCATEILIGRNEYEFNLILNQIIDDELATNMEEILKFRSKWIKNVMF